MGSYVIDLSPILAGLAVLAVNLPHAAGCGTERIF
jgi:hypothetical protein